MVGRVLAIGMLFSTVLASLVLFPSDNAEAVRFKIKCEVEIECKGANGTYDGGTGDDSCKEGAFGARGAGLTADIVTTSQIPLATPKYSNVSIPAATGTPDTWKLSTDKELPNGAYVGTLTGQVTLALLGGTCTNTLVISIPIYDCTTANFEGVNDGCPAVGAAESGSRCNDSLDRDGDTLVNDGCPRVATNDDAPDDTVPNDGCPAVGAAAEWPGAFPSWCLNNVDDDADTVVNDGCPQVGGFGESGAQCVDAESAGNCADAEDDDGDGDPIIAWDAGVRGNNLTYGKKGDLPDGCTNYPQHLNTLLDGLKPRARYFGFSPPFPGQRPMQVEFLFFSTEEVTAIGALPATDMGDAAGYINLVIPDNPLVPLPPGDPLDEICTPLSTSTTLLGTTGGEGELSQDVPPVPTPPASFWTIPDACGDGVDNDGDTRTDEMCGIVRSRNPAANTGILGSGSHLVKSYAQSYRDADGDTIANNEDECPITVDVGIDTDGDRIDDACDPTPGLPAELDEDSDGYLNQQDNCPLVSNVSQADADRDDIGDACDLNPTTPNGPYVNDMPVGSVCIGAADADGDGWCDATETSLMSIPLTAPEGGTEAGYAKCSDTIDNDGDGYIDGTVAPTWCAGLGCDAGCQTPESYVVDMTIKAAEDPPGAGPQSCTNWDYYDTTVSHPGTPHQNGAPWPGAGIDDDADTTINQYDTGCYCPGNDLDCDGVVDASGDNCNPTTVAACAGANAYKCYNPSQLNTDRFAAGKGDALGDACDSDDDQDQTLDSAEWAAGTDPKNICDPRNYDLNQTPPSAGVINILDVLAFSNAILDAPCNPPVNYAVCEPIYRSR